MAILTLIFMVLAIDSTLSSEVREHQLRQFNAGQDTYYASAGELNLGASSAGKECNHPDEDAVENARIRCTYSGCRVRCQRGYKMGTSRFLFLSCDTTSGELTYLGMPWEISLPPCLPSCDKYGCPEGQECIAPDTCAPSNSLPSDCPPGFAGPNCKDFGCDPPCQNGGTCIFIDVCDCPVGYWGLLCEKHRCAVPAETPNHATYGGDNDLTTLKVECQNGYTMKSGASSATFICSHQQWIIPNKGNMDDIDTNCYRA
ncbi:hypothetical protein SK128_015399 [Halocaridina rubra]|uniref:EGF-like domain-containing protein n=1 Tax=Halocaridina rubra TaxID=373956 RepID=A0AAN9A772_HALRR